MAAPIEVVPKHHQRDEVCSTRPPYREGRIPKAVKVYTINQESRYVLVQGVPAVGASHELVKLFALYGAVDEYRILDDYPSEDFSEAYLICFKKIQSARFAKKKLDDYSFFGGILHVCYAPEYESVAETRQKLQDRRKVIAAKTRQNASDGFSSPMEGTSKNEVISSELLPSVNHDDRSSTHGSQMHSNRFETSEVHHSANSHSESDKHQLSVSNVSSQSYFHSSEQQRIDNSLEVNFRIPPPPLPGQNSSYFKNRNSKFEFARVPSAHSTLPVNFDGRLPVHSNLERNNSKSISKTNRITSLSSINVNSTKDTSSFVPKISKSADDEQMGKVPKNVSGKLIIRDYKKKGPVPRFVPRQAVIDKDKAKNRLETKDKQLAEDDLNQEIKRNAYKLGHVEGPTLPDRDVLTKSLNIPVEREQSVNQTVLEIRKRISKFISESTPVTKKKKES